MTSTTLRPVSVKLDAEEHLRLKALAETRQRKPHFLMKEALRQYGLAGAFEQKLTVSNLVVRMADLHSYQQRKLPTIIGISGVGTVYFAFFT